MFACKIAVSMHKLSCKVLTKTAMLRNVLGQVAAPAVVEDMLVNVLTCTKSTHECWSYIPVCGTINNPHLGILVSALKQY